MIQHGLHFTVEAVCWGNTEISTSYVFVNAGHINCRNRHYKAFLIEPPLQTYAHVCWQDKLAGKGK